MAVHKNFSPKERQVKSGYFDDPNLAGSKLNRVEDVDYEE